MTGAPQSGERGIALLQVVLLMTLVTTAAAGAALLARVEVLLAYSHQSERDAAYAAQAILAATLQELDRAPDWDAVLAGAALASFADGPAAGSKRIPGGGTIEVCCGAASMTLRARSEDGIAWQPFGWCSLSGLLDLADAPRYYLAAWVVDDYEDSDGNIATDANDRLMVRAEAATPLGVRRALEVLIERAALDAATGTRAPGMRILSWLEVR
jgi:hypothetical protein